MPVRVAPVDEYCQAFYDWKRVIGEKVEELGRTYEEVHAELVKRWGVIPERLTELEDPTVEERALFFRHWHLRSEIENWQKVLEALNFLMLPIMKSNYLFRRIYAGQPHRTEKCPIHAGVWSGYYNPEPCDEGCTSGYDQTGWLPERHKFEPIDEFPQEGDHWIWGFPEPESRCKHCFGKAGALVHEPKEAS